MNAQFATPKVTTSPFLTENSKLDTSTLLGDYADLINKYGVASRQAEEFLHAYRNNQEFVELAQTAKLLRMKLDQYQARTRHERSSGSKLGTFLGKLSKSLFG